MALADKTRLRLINLMRNEEVCVCFFTEVLGESQPKISRHLAYLRNARIVRSRREGKWMHYSIVEPKSDGGKRVLDSVLVWLEDQEEMRQEHERYKRVCGSPEILAQIARTPIPFALANTETVDELEYKYAHSAHNELDEFLL